MPFRAFGCLGIYPYYAIGCDVSESKINHRLILEMCQCVCGCVVRWVHLCGFDCVCVCPTMTRV